MKVYSSRPESRALPDAELRAALWEHDEWTKKYARSASPYAYEMVVVSEDLLLCEAGRRWREVPR